MVNGRILSNLIHKKHYFLQGHSCWQWNTTKGTTQLHSANGQYWSCRSNGRSVYKIMNCRLNTVALLEILSIVRRHGLIHDNNNVPIEKIHVKSLRCGASKDIAVSSRDDYLQGLPQNRITLRSVADVLLWKDKMGSLRISQKKWPWVCSLRSRDANFF